MIRVFIRLMKDVKAIDAEKYVALESIVDEIGRMLGVRIIAPIHLCHQALNFTSHWKRNYMFLALNLI